MHSMKKHIFEFSSSVVRAISLVISPQCDADVLILSSIKGYWLLLTHLHYVLPTQPRSDGERLVSLWMPNAKFISSG